MAEVDDRLDNVDRRLTSVETGLGELRIEVQKLRILGEENAADVKRIAEVQVQHGGKLDDHARKLEGIAKALEPLAAIDAFVRLVADNHEKRISDLERHSGIHESPAR